MQVRKLWYDFVEGDFARMYKKTTTAVAKAATKLQDAALETEDEATEPKPPPEGTSDEEETEDASASVLAGDFLKAAALVKKLPAAPQRDYHEYLELAYILRQMFPGKYHPEYLLGMQQLRCLERKDTGDTAEQRQREICYLLLNLMYCVATEPLPDLDAPYAGQWREYYDNHAAVHMLSAAGSAAGAGMMMFSVENPNQRLPGSSKSVPVVAALMRLQTPSLDWPTTTSKSKELTEASYDHDTKVWHLSRRMPDALDIDS